MQSMVISIRHIFKNYFKVKKKKDEWRMYDGHKYLKTICVFLLNFIIIELRMNFNIFRQYCFLCVCTCCVHLPNKGTR